MALKEYNYYYENGSLIRSVEFDITLDSNEFVTSKTQNLSTVYYYDSEGTLEKKIVSSKDGLDQHFFYEKGEKGDTVLKIKLGDSQIMSHSKTDSFGRKVFDEIQGGATAISREFSYHEGEITDAHIENNKVKSAPTTLLVKDITFSDGRTLSYEYDNEERITKVTDSVDGVTEYTYDALGQLLTETKGETVVNSMVYDNYGNITSKNGISYGYDSTWKDLLVSYNNTPIVYDAQGNPTSYLGHTLTWEKGRQLKSFDNISYTYNANGIRTSKTVNGVKHSYVLDGTKILQINCEQNYILEPIYDNADNVCGMYYNSEPFYFIKNLQGDIIAISNYWGEIVARYTYDAWGKITNISGSRMDIANANPFRYRSYFYDTETSLYYLQSRYYDANIGRFINADEPSIFVFVKNSIKTDLFVYCSNNSVNENDDSGHAVGDYIHAIGIQIAITIGCVPVGVEFLWSTKTWKPTVFVFSGAAASATPSKGYNIITNWLLPMFKNVPRIASSVFNIISRSNLSISFVGVFGSKKQVFPAGYCGLFKGFSASIRIFWVNVAFSAAIGKNSNGIIGSVGIGVSISNGLSLSKTYYVQLTGNNAGKNNLITLFDTLRGKIKSYMDKFKAIAGFLS